MDYEWSSAEAATESFFHTEEYLFALAPNIIATRKTKMPIVTAYVNIPSAIDVIRQLSTIKLLLAGFSARF
jgi:hypothetical protein